jgi:hypothetical protein
MTSFSNSIIDNLKVFQPQKPGHFDVMMGIPTGGGGVQTINFNPNAIQYGLAQAFTTPTKEFEVKEFSYYGIKRKIPIRRKFGTFSVSFLLDDFLAIAGWIEYWMDIVINPFTDYIEDYNPAISSGFVELKPVDQNFQFGGVYKFLEAYPVQILPIEFDTSNRNTTMRYSVLFNCTEYFFEGANYKTSSRSGPR